MHNAVRQRQEIEPPRIAAWNLKRGVKNSRYFTTRAEKDNEVICETVWKNVVLSSVTLVEGP